jgi:PTS system glucose-specific IIC component
MAGELVAAFGGRDNIQSLDACITRLRVQLVDPSRANPDRLKALGATGVVKISNNLQAIFGTRSENLKSDMEAYLRGSGGFEPPTVSASSGAAQPTTARAGAPDEHLLRTGESIASALGGERNIVSVEACALTRVRVKVVDLARVDDAALRRTGAAGIMRLDANVLHLIVGPRADVLASAMASQLDRRAALSGPPTRA